MSVLGITYPSLADKLKRTDPDGRIATIIEMMVELNEVLEDVVTVEGNLPTGHRTTVRTGIPSGTWRKLYGGVAPQKSTTAQVDDTCGMLEAYAQVDKALADLNGNTAAFRLSESTAFLEGMNQDFVDCLFTGNNSTTPEKFMGFAPRYSVKSTDRTKSGYNIVDAGGTGSDNRSIYLVTWGENTCHLTHPKGSQAGLQHTDKGQVTHTNTDGSMYEAYRDHFKWDVGLVVRDWRSCARIANIDLSDLTAGTVALEDWLIDAYYKTRRQKGKKAIYVPTEIGPALHKRAKDTANINLTIKEFGGQEIPAFLGIPIRTVDALAVDETRVT